MASFLVSPESPSACELTTEPEVQLESALQQQSIDSALLDHEPESVRSYTSNDIEKSDTLCAVFDSVSFITEQL